MRKEDAEEFAALVEQVIDALEVSKIPPATPNLPVALGVLAGNLTAVLTIRGAKTFSSVEEEVRYLVEGAVIIAGSVALGMTAGKSAEITRMVHEQMQALLEQVRAGKGFGPVDVSEDDF